MAFTCIHTKAHGIYMHKHIHERVYVRIHVLVVDEKLIVIPVLVDSDHVDEQVLGGVGSVLKILHCFATHPYGKREGRRRVGEEEEEQKKIFVFNNITFVFNNTIYSILYMGEAADRKVSNKALSRSLSPARALSLATYSTGRRAIYHSGQQRESMSLANGPPTCRNKKKGLYP